MRRTILAFVLILFCASFAEAQSTTVSGTITDANSQAFASGAYRIEFNPGPAPPPYQWNGSPFIPGNNVFTGSLDGSGSFSGISVPSNTSIAPNTQWKFTFCPAATSPCYSKSIAVTGATLDVTSQMTPPAIVVYSNTYNQPTAYSDSEISNPVVGFTYFNIASQTNRTCTVSIPCIWISGSGSGGGVDVLYQQAYTQRTTVIGPVTAYTTPSSPASAAYRITVSTNCDTAVTSAGVTGSVSWTDPSGTVQAADIGTAACTTLGGASWIYTLYPINVKGGTAITYLTTFITGAVPTYDLHVLLEGTW